MDRELDVINTLGFASYFLICWDFVRHARDNGIPASVRGSGVGSLVAYSLYLSHVCPLEYDLLFERFLDVSRLEAPDIDIDFCKERRGEVIDYVKQKYGEANVAQIGTFGTFAASGSYSRCWSGVGYVDTSGRQDHFTCTRSARHYFLQRRLFQVHSWLMHVMPMPKFKSW